MASSYKPTLHISTSIPIPPSTDTTMSDSAYVLVTPPETPIAPIPDSDWASLNNRLGSADANRRTALLSLPPAPPNPYTDSGAILGLGAWSKVVRGTLDGIVVAIKRPTRHDAAKVIEDEARVLSYVSSTGHSAEIARYIGYDMHTSALVMEAIDGVTLSQYSHEMGSRSRGSMQREPVIGRLQWLEISAHLAGAFAHLKRSGVVHGDVTWNNVLVQTHPTTGAIMPVLIDFSSGHLDVAGFDPDPISAVTTGFCSPELLESFLRRPIAGQAQTASPPPSPTNSSKAAAAQPCPVPTYASDLYGLAMTLLCAAIGAEVYENAGRHVGIYARSGQPLEWVRNGDAMMIASVRSVVSRTLTGCFGRDAEKRVQVEELRERVLGAIEAA